MYVVFFEIIPKGKTVGGTGKQHISAMILGFAVFLPSLYLRKDQNFPMMISDGKMNDAILCSDRLDLI